MKKMEIEEVSVVEYEMIYFKQLGNQYRRYNQGNWGVVIGESEESILDEEEIRALDRAYASFKNNRMPISVGSKVIVHSGDDIFEDVVINYEWDVDQWAYLIRDEWFCQSEVVEI